MNVPLDPGPRRKGRRTLPLLLGAVALLLAISAARHRASRPAPTAGATAVAAAPPAAAPSAPAPAAADFDAKAGGPKDPDLRDPPPEDGNGS